MLNYENCASSGGMRQFGSGFMDGDRSCASALGRGRKLTAADLRLVILGLLSLKSHHGYEIIKALADRSNGFYCPSPGVVYPSLTNLQAIGHAIVRREGARKLYHLTDPGRAYLSEHQTAADALFEQFDRVAGRMDDLRRAISVARFEGFPLDPEPRGSKELVQAHHDFKQALNGRWASPREEQQRVADVLRRATAEIVALQGARV